MSPTLADQLKDPSFTPDRARSAGRTVVITRVSDINTLPVKWLWHYRIAQGMFGLFPGQEGFGKSLVTCDLTARITRGTLDGDCFGTPRKVLICATEDSFAHTIAPRLIAAGADLDLVGKVDVHVSDHVEDLSLPVDLAALTQRIIESQIALVVLDPLTSRLSARIDTHKDAEVRRALEPLVKLAEETNASVLGIIHLNKGTDRNPLNAIMGSRAFSAVSRYTFYIAADPDTEGVRLIGQAKNTNGPDTLPLLPFRIEGHSFVNAQGHTIETARVAWQAPDTTGRRLHEVLREAHDGRGQARDHAGTWLRDYLEGCEGLRARSQDVKRAAEAAGHKKRTLERATKQLGVTVTWEGKESWWTMPELPF